MSKTFEEFLREKYAKEYQKIKEAIKADNLDVCILILFAEEWHTAQMKEVLERIKFQPYTIKTSEVFNARIDEELAKLTVK